MPEILSLALRPRTLSALVGQTATVAAIRKHMETRPPRAWLFWGASGTGKTTIARILAVSYQCSHMKLWGDPCEACWTNQSNFAIHEINASDASGIDELGQVVKLSRYRPTYEGGKRVIILDEAQKISSSAKDMLLKPLEEPAPSTVWIICTTEHGKITPTMRRRCTEYQLKGLNIEAAELFLRNQAKRTQITRPLEPLFEQLHTLQVNAPALLLQALEKFAAGSSAMEAVSGADGTSVDSLRICKAVTAGQWPEIREQLKDATGDEVRWIRASVCGWLKGCLAREKDPRRRERITNSMLDLCNMPFDENILLPWLWATLEKITRRFIQTSGG